MGREAGRTRKFVFNLKNSPDTRNFNNCLRQVVDKISRAGRESEAGSPEDNVFGGYVMLQTVPLTGSVSLMASAPMPGPRPLGAEAPSLSAGDLPSGIAGGRLQEKLPTSVAQQVSEELAAAIQEGNVSKAQQLAAMLAQGHTRLTVSFDAEAQDKRSNEAEISVTVHVEDRESAGLTLTDMKVRPSDTILDVKRMFYGKYGFPFEVQKWIIGNRIRNDEETLARCDVHTSGHTLYLYLLSARAVNISRDDYKRPGQGNAAAGPRRLGSRPKSGDYELMRMPVAPPAGQGGPSPVQGQGLPRPPSQGQVISQGQGGTARQQSQLSAASSSSSLAGPTSGLSELRVALETPSNPNSSESPSTSRPGESRQGQGETLPPDVAAEPPIASGGGGGRPLREPPQRIPQQPATQLGWQCETCTLINQPTRPGCEACGSPRPPGYEVPAGYVVSEEEQQRLEREQQLEALMQQEETRQRQQNYQQLLQAESADLVANTQNFDCPICFDDVLPGDGVVLRECLHMFCKSCLMEAVRLTEEAQLKCPFQDNSYSCNANLQDREVRALVSDQVYERYLRRSLDVAESQAPNSYHCKTADCRGWCIYEDLVNFFRCPVCRHENCLTCRAIHEGMNCKQYQEDLRTRAANDEAAKQTQAVLQGMLEKGEAMHCPKCQVIVQKKDGCDWIRCSICKTEICWVTKGPRWGPKGEGDTSGGCQCRVGGRRCHPKCTNCH